MGLKVYKEYCKNCLFSKDAIVSPERRKDIVQHCTKNQTHFICHKSDDVVCNTFYEKLGGVSQMVRIAERLDMIEFVEQAEHEKLMPHKR